MGDGEADWYGVRRDADSAPVRCGEEAAERKGKALNLLVDLCSYPHQWSRALGSDQKNKIAGTSDSGN